MTLEREPSTARPVEAVRGRKGVTIRLRTRIVKRHMANSTPSRARRVLRQALPWGMALLLMIGLGQSFAGQPVLAAGADAPPVQLFLSDGTQFDLANQRGRVVVLNFWGSFCPPCRHEAPVLTRAHRALQQQGGLVLGLSVDRQPDTAAGRAAIGQAARSMGMDFPVGLAPRAAVQHFRVSALPSTFVIGSDGRVTESLVGMVSDRWLAEAIRKAQ